MFVLKSSAPPEPYLLRLAFLGISRFLPKFVLPQVRLFAEASSRIPANASLELEKESEEGKGEAKSLSRRIEKLARGESVAAAFQSWMGEGLPIHRGDVFHTINRLRKLKATRRALEVMEWVIRERPYRPKELDYAYLLEFTIKFHGISQGEALFSRTPSDFKSELLYNNLVLGCLDKGLIRLSLAYMKKMRELGHSISHLAFNRLITLHSSPGRKKSIPKILTQMRADKVARHVSTYNILLKIEADDHNIDGLTRVFSEMTAEPNEVTYCILAVAHAVARLYAACEVYVESIEKSMTGDNWSTLDILMILYGRLGKAKDLERTWSSIRALPRIRTRSFLLAIEAFGRTGNLDRADEIWVEMASKKGLKSTEQFNSMIGAQCRNGAITRATALYKEMSGNGCKPNAITLRHLCLGCLKAGLVEEGVRTLEAGMDFPTSEKVRRSTPWLETTFAVMEVFAERGDVGMAEKLFFELRRRKYTRYTFVYNGLLKGYVKGKVYEAGFVRRMILGGSRPDSETYSLVKVMEEFRHGS
ncbi:pentatricopeptide repeat-containing protein At1g07590, mitochondrial [Andrographis paniculata]|uniref:pentatricopeptide repeat-containing protein At1g07590, mitochondrial n=1 Tax=Andrographis paniculata TaxID=175694 RepID=UPI0021E8B87F|nr:pentatricopeptide repeat-containing protein At1g07590, mitochondrial [Andrographis paniculata]